MNKSIRKIMSSGISHSKKQEAILTRRNLELKSLKMQHTNLTKAYKAAMEIIVMQAIELKRWPLPEDERP